MLGIVLVGHVRAGETGEQVDVVGFVGAGEAVVKVTRAAEVRSNSLFMVLFYEIEVARHEKTEILRDNR